MTTRRDLIDPHKIIDSSGISARYGVSRQTVTNWKTRTDFPAPLATPLCQGNPIYDVEVIDAWMEANTRTVTVTTRMLNR